jgi:hypothetical protein
MGLRPILVINKVCSDIIYSTICTAMHSLAYNQREVRQREAEKIPAWTS